MFYGYCHESNRMRAMDYSDFITNMQTGYSNIYSNPGAAMQPMVEALTNMMRGTGGSPRTGKQSRHRHGCGCSERDCSCSCCIRCADVVEYARCGETRRIPITFDNDTRRERDVTLQIGNFATESGQDVGWQGSLSETQFKLPPCGEKTVLLTVNVDCGRLGVPGTPNDPNGSDNQGRRSVDACKVVYATLRADGCTIRPIVIAVAVLPDHCGSHHAGCGCGCCC